MNDPRRRVRCDERRPYCKGCVRLGHKCEYAPPVVQPQVGQPKPMQLQILLPAPGPIWTETDSLRAAYRSAFQRYDPIGLSNSEAFAEVIPRESFGDDVFHYICMSLGALSLSVVARSLASCDDASLISLATSSPLDAHHAKAIRHYTTALSRLRKRLGSEAASVSPRIMLLSMGAMACFEIMQGNMLASCHIQLACFSILGDVVISKAESGDSKRFGLTALYEDDLSIEEIEAVHLRLAAMCVLWSPEQFKRTHRRTMPMPRPCVRDFPPPDIPIQNFQTSWNEFAHKFESWRLACYWDVCLNGTSAELPDFLHDQRILADCLQSWERIIRSRIRLTRSGCLSLEQCNPEALRLLLIFIRTMQLFLAPEDEDTTKIESLHATDLADLARLPLRPMSRFIGGFYIGSWNDFMIDSRLLPLIKFMVLKRQHPTPTINVKLARMQLDKGEAIWFTLKEYYERSRTHYDPGFLPVQSRLSWTFLWWKHYREFFKATINDMGHEDEKSSCCTNTIDSNRRN